MKLASFVCLFLLVATSLFGQSPQVSLVNQRTGSFLRGITGDHKRGLAHPFVSHPNVAGIFAAPVAYGPGGNQSVSVAVGDFNGDGNLDVAVANLCPSGGNVIGVLFGKGNGTFRTTQQKNAPKSAVGCKMRLQLRS